MSLWTIYLTLLFVMPLPFGGYTDWAWPLYTTASLLLLITTLQQHLKQQRPLPEPLQKSRWMLWLLAAVQLWVLIQIFVVSKTPYDTFTYWLKGIGYTSFMALSLILIDSKQRIRQIIWTVVLAAAFQAFYGAIMVMTKLEYGFFLEKWTYKRYVTGTFVSKNHVSGYLEMALALGIGFLLAQSTHYHGSFRQRLRQLITMLLSSKVVLRLTLAILVIALVMTRSRMGNSAFFASMMITGALALLLMRQKSKSTTILLASLLIIDITIVGTFFGVDKVAERLQNTSTETESRDEVSRDTFNMWLEQPLAGIGAGTFQYRFPEHKSLDITAEQLYNHTHNDYLQFLSEFGAPAFVLMLCVVLASLWNAIQAMRLRRSDLMKGLGFAATMGIISIGIHSVVDFNLQVPANAYLFMLLLALANIARWAPHESEHEHQRSRRRHTRTE
ncbi:O-antigen ligase family protein [Oceanobacter mangrovi]|uniref:O-antigen ligase family protein n=1 Tax=Oceanobacter mangrovi TaxID=2862510 RepID=UPI001C8DCF97|nr:O-antigen ligase family protein [Oceanobacter mangrovi]